MKGATEILSHTLMLCITNAFFFGILSFIFLDNILIFFGASPDTLPYARSFMQVILLGNPITYTMIGLNNVMRATGDAYFDGNGSSQYHPRSHLYISF